MGLIRALKIRSRFTDVQREFISHKKLVGEQTPAEWLDFMEEIAQFDEAADTFRGRMQTITIIAWVVFAIALFILGVYALPILAAAIVSNCIYLLLDRIDIPNRMRLLVLPLIAILKEEMKEDEKLFLEVNFNHKPNKDTQVGKDVESQVMGRKITTSHYQYPLVWLKGKLFDGSVLELTLTDRVRKNNISKRNPRGKTKLKTKYKIKTDYEICLRLKKEAYRLKDDRTVSAKTGDILLTHESKESREVLRLHTQMIATDPEHIPKVHKIVNLIGLCYAKVKQSAVTQA